MSPPANNGVDQEGNVCSELPSIPILACRWGLGEGVSPMVFKPLVIPQHLLRTSDDAASEPARRPRGRGRAAGLSSHDDPLPVPGTFTNVGVSNLTIQEQINRVRGDLPIYEPPTNYSRYILPRRASLDEEFADRGSDAASAPSPQRIITHTHVTHNEHGGWKEVLHPNFESVPVESTLLASNYGADGKNRSSDRYKQLGADSDDPDMCEELTSSSNLSDDGGLSRRWRPRPPALDKESFPPLPGAAASPTKPARAASGQRPPPPAGGNSPVKMSRRARRAARKQSASADRSASVTSSAANGAEADPQTTDSGLASGGEVNAGGAKGGKVHAEAADGGEVSAEAGEGARLRVTGITDDNWKNVQEYVEAYDASIREAERGPDGIAWITLTSAEIAQWIVSLHQTVQCDISDDITFQHAERDDYS